MSNELAIAGVTAALTNLLTKQIPGDQAAFTVMATPPEKIKGNAQILNVFLYNISYDPALANMGMEGNRLKPFDSGLPPVPLVLHYLITAYAAGDSDVESHTLLGAAMRVMLDNPVLGPQQLQGLVPSSDIHDQIERVRITREAIGVDEMSKIWAMSEAASYRLSVGYQVSAVLIESRRPAKSPLPVLTRGPENKGIESQPDLTPPFPTITEIKPQKKQPGVRLGETFSVEGFHLNGLKVTAQFKHPRREEMILVPVDAESTATEAKITIPVEPDKWLAGIYTLSLVIEPAKEGEQVRETNELPVALSPEITALPDPPDEPDLQIPLPLRKPLTVSINSDPPNDAILMMTCRPDVLPAQTALLLLSDEKARQISALPRANSTDPLQFIISSPTPTGPAGVFIRLRIDGIDSLLVEDYGAPVLKFNSKQKLIIDG